jgi:hypothetical protein
MIQTNINTSFSYIKKRLTLKKTDKASLKKFIK